MIVLGNMNIDDYSDFVRDASMTGDEPESLGISNKKWSSSLESNILCGGHDASTLSQVLNCCF